MCVSCVCCFFLNFFAFFLCQTYLSCIRKTARDLPVGRAWLFFHHEIIYSMLPSHSKTMVTLYHGPVDRAETSQHGQPKQQKSLHKSGGGHRRMQRRNEAMRKESWVGTIETDG